MKFGISIILCCFLSTVFQCCASSKQIEETVDNSRRSLFWFWKPKVESKQTPTAIPAVPAVETPKTTAVVAPKTNEVSTIKTTKSVVSDIPIIKKATQVTPNVTYPKKNIFTSTAIATKDVSHRDGVKLSGGTYATVIQKVSNKTSASAIDQYFNSTSVKSSHKAALPVPLKSFVGAKPNISALLPPKKPIPIKKNSTTPQTSIKLTSGTYATVTLRKNATVSAIKPPPLQTPRAANKMSNATRIRPGRDATERKPARHFRRV